MLTEVASSTDQDKVLACPWIIFEGSGANDFTTGGEDDDQ